MLHSKAHVHTYTYIGTHQLSLPAPPGELAACQARHFLLGVHNLSQALIESRVIYNVAVPLTEWAAPSCYSSGQGLWPPPIFFTQGRIHRPLRGRRGPSSPCNQLLSFFLPFSQARHWPLGGFDSTHHPSTPTTKPSIQSPATKR